MSSLREGSADGKENKQPKSVSKDDEYEDNQLSHQDDEYISSNETRLAMEPVKPESEYVFIQRTPKSSTTEFDNSKSSSSSKTFHRREGQVSPGGKRKEPMRYPSNDFDDKHEDEQLSDMDGEYVSCDETMTAEEPDTTKIKPESEGLVIQPTQKPSTTELDDFGLPSSDESSSSKTFHRREGQVSPVGKGKEPMRYLSNDFDDKHKDKQLSHQDDAYISSNETKIEMVPDTTEIESLLIHPAKGASTTGFQGSDDSNLQQFFPKTLFQRRKGQVTPLVINTKRAAQEKECLPPSQDEEDNSKQWRIKKEQIKMDKNEQFGMDKAEQSNMDEGGPSKMDKYEQARIAKEEQCKMYDAFLDSDEELQSSGESSAQDGWNHDGWTGDGDQMEALVLLLRWARSYRLTIKQAGRMLKMGPEIVNRALWVEATGQPIVLRIKPVIKHWLKLGPLEDFFFAP